MRVLVVANLPSGPSSRREVPEVDVLQFLMSQVRKNAVPPKIEWCDVQDTMVACQSFRPDFIVAAVIGGQNLARIYTHVANLPPKLGGDTPILAMHDQLVNEAARVSRKGALLDREDLYRCVTKHLPKSDAA